MGVRHGERYVEDAGQGLGQQRLATAGGTDQQDVRLGEFDVSGLAGQTGVGASRSVGQPLVVVMHGHRQDALGVLLANQ